MMNKHMADENLTKRYLTTYRIDKDLIEVFTENDDYKTAVDNADDWVWQFAENAEQAKNQYFVKLDLWEQDPTRDTY